VHVLVQCKLTYKTKTKLKLAFNLVLGLTKNDDENAHRPYGSVLCGLYFDSQKFLEYMLHPAKPWVCLHSAASDYQHDDDKDDELIMKMTRERRQLTLTNRRQSAVEMRRLRKPVSETCLTSSNQIQQYHQVLYTHLRLSLLSQKKTCTVYNSHRIKYKI